MGTFSIWHWLVVLVIVALVFGTKKLRNLGGDLGSALKGFKEGIKETEANQTGTSQSEEATGSVIEATVENKTATNFSSPTQAQEANAKVSTVSINISTDNNNQPDIVNISTSPSNISGADDKVESKIDIQTNR